MKHWIIVALFAMTPLACANTVEDACENARDVCEAFAKEVSQDACVESAEKDAPSDDEIDCVVDASSCADLEKCD